jgi:hypothetical protein
VIDLNYFILILEYWERRRGAQVGKNGRKGSAGGLAN